MILNICMNNHMKFIARESLYKAIEGSFRKAAVSLYGCLFYYNFLYVTMFLNSFSLTFY